MEDQRPLEPVVEAEESLLGSIFIDPIEGIVFARALVEPADFYRVEHKQIFQAMCDLDDEGVPLDLITVTDRLRKYEQLSEIGGEAFLIGLINTVPTSINLEAYARIVRDRSRRKRGIAALGAALNLYQDVTLPTDEVLDQVEHLIYEVRDGERPENYRTTKQATADYLDRVTAAHERGDGMIGLPWGFQDLDRVTGGIPDEEFITIGARPGMGKTSLLLSIMENLGLKHGKTVGMFSMEMPVHMLLNRLVARRTRIDSQRLRKGNLTEEEWPKFHEVVGQISEANIIFDETPNLTVSQMRSRSRRWATIHGLDIILLDYVQLMFPEIADARLPRVQQMSTITRGIKGLSRELGIPVVAAAQLNRAVEQRQEKRPQLSDLRDSGTIEQDSDTVIFIYRDDVYNPDMGDRPNIAELDIAKHRNGPTATVDLYWQGQLATFRSLARQEISVGDYGQGPVYTNGHNEEVAQAAMKERYGAT